MIPNNTQLNTALNKLKMLHSKSLDLKNFFHENSFEHSKLLIQSSAEALVLLSDLTSLIPANIDLVFLLQENWMQRGLVINNQYSYVYVQKSSVSNIYLSFE